MAPAPVGPIVPLLPRRNVSFGEIEFHEFLPAIGDNPAVSCGVPISLSETLENTSVIDIEFYERIRSPRRSGRSLILTRNVREEMYVGRLAFLSKY